MTRSIKIKTLVSFKLVKYVKQILVYKIEINFQVKQNKKKILL